MSEFCQIGIRLNHSVWSWFRLVSVAELNQSNQKLVVQLFPTIYMVYSVHYVFISVSDLSRRLGQCPSATSSGEDSSSRRRKRSSTNSSSTNSNNRTNTNNSSTSTIINTSTRRTRRSPFLDIFKIDWAQLFRQLKVEGWYSSSDWTIYSVIIDWAQLFRQLKVDGWYSSSDSTIYSVIIASIPQATDRTVEFAIINKKCTVFSANN